MGNLLAETLPLALGAAISPLVLMGALALLGGQNAKARVTAYTVGFVITCAALLAVGLVLVVAQQRKAGTSPLESGTAEWITGILLIAFAALMVRPKRRDDGARAQKHHRTFVKPDAPLYAFALFGAVMMLVDFSSIVFLLAILHRIGSAGAPIGPSVVVLALALLCTSLPALLPTAVALFGGPALSAKVTELGHWTNRNGRYILAVLFFVFGLQDILKALGH